MKYYAIITDEILSGKAQCPCYGDNAFSVEITEEIYNNIEQYIYSDGEIVINPEWDNIQLNKAKDEKIKLNDELRDRALLQGVEYQNVLFDSDTDQKVNLLATVGMMSDSDTIVWYGMDNQGLLCNKQDLSNIGLLITELHSFCWGNNAYIKEQIANAQTIEELETIEINYNREEE